MKTAVDHPKTQAALKQWAGSVKLCQANHFFWNQGFPMQKSRTGLLQALCYQILRQIPTLIPMIDSDHLTHEEWSLKELEALFDRIMVETDPTTGSLPTRFCFFIDGLDEYEGEEGDIADLVVSI